MFNTDRLKSAYQKVRNDLLSERNAEGHWIGQLASSALSTATAVSALSLVQRNGGAESEHEFDELIDGGLNWILPQQNGDGGWGDTDQSYSNIATSMLVIAALNLAGRATEHSDAIARAEDYIERKGGIGGLRKRYGKDKTFAVPILTNCALAGIVPWSEVSPLPFEAACVPQKLYRFMQMPVVSYAIPALVAIGQARYFHLKPWNPVSRIIRALAVEPSLRVLGKMQPASGGFLEAAPLTSFVTMGLAGTGRAEHPVAKNGVKYLLSSVREDGSWPIDTNLATWTTTLALNALAGAGEDIAAMEPRCLEWVLSCQYREIHPYTGAEPGGWGWSDLSGAVPDADDTPGAMLALANWKSSPSCSDSERDQIHDALTAGSTWLINLQNNNGGWPTFCRGWGKLPFDRSGTDLTAHVLRALRKNDTDLKQSPIPTDEAVIDRGFRYLDRQQREDGSWVPLWFGNQDHPEEENPIYGTAKVLLVYRDFGRTDTKVMRRGLNWLKDSQNTDGGWGGGPAMIDHQFDPAIKPQQDEKSYPSSVEETALAVEALLSASDDPSLQGTIDKGLEWLCSKVEKNKHRETSPIGFYFAKLWYHEKLYPLIFTVSALGQALHQSHLPPKPTTDAARQNETSEATETSEV